MFCELDVNKETKRPTTEAQGKAIERVSKVLSGVKKSYPQGLKPASLAALGGTAKAVPYPKPIF
jgi:hypothetical protein